MGVDEVPDLSQTTSSIGVISDTHGHIVNTRRAVRMFESMQVQQVLHCGDIGSPEIPPLFDAWPTHYVLGNVDGGGGGALLESIQAAGGTCYGRFGDLTIGRRRIVLLHGDDERRLHEVAHSGDWDLICTGHTHTARQAWEGRTLILNPGALVRAWPISVAVVELHDLTATIIPLDDPR